MGIKVARLTSRNNRASVYLDLARGVAALEVMMYHVRPTLLVPFTAIDHKHILDLFLYGITDKGFQAVMVFFVLSGFFISSSVLRALVNGRWSWKDYLNNRLTRLWLVLIPALILTYVWNRFSLAIFHGDAFVGDMGWASFARNVFFLQGIWHFPGTPFGENDALWSLTYEFWYYILFPCVLLIYFSKKWFTKCVYALASISLGIFLGKTILMYFLIWLIGSLIVIIPTFNARYLSQKPALIIAFVLFLVALGLGTRNHNYVSDLSVGLTFGLLTYFCVNFFNDSVSIPRFTGRSVQAFASFSYTLYLTHFPINNFLVSWIGRHKIQPSPTGVGILMGTFLVIVLFAWAVSLATEAHTDKVRRFNQSLLIRISKIPLLQVLASLYPSER